MNYNELRQDTTVQRTLPWYRARLGKITGSEVYKIIGKGKGKPYTATGMKYLHKVRAERHRSPDMVADDELFGNYINRMEISSKAIRWGTEHEDEARSVFLYLLKHDKEYADTFAHLRSIEVGSCAHPTIEGFNSSPDGTLCEDDGYIVAALEIKCPDPDTHDGYLDILNADDLKKEKPEYYWQCMSHMAVIGAQCCFFISYDPDAEEACHYILVPRSDKDVELLEERVKHSLDGIENLKELFAA